MGDRAATQSTGAKVLVVDDERDLADLYGAWLAENYHTSVVYSGDAALDAVNDDTDVVLLDRRMPGMAGDEVLDELAARNLDCRVAMLTAVSPDFDVIGMGFDDYVVKPVTQDELTDTVERLLKRAQHDEGVQELFALSEKQALLQTEMTAGELDGNERFNELRERIEAKRSELRDHVAGMDDADLRVLMEGLTPGERT